MFYLQKDKTELPLQRILSLGTKILVGVQSTRTWILVPLLCNSPRNMTYSDTHTYIYTHYLISHHELVYCTFLKVLPMCQLPRQRYSDSKVYMVSSNLVIDTRHILVLEEEHILVFSLITFYLENLVLTHLFILYPFSIDLRNFSLICHGKS